MYRKTVLDNEVRIVTESLPSRLVSLGIWVDVGSRDENEQTSGSAHFAEHMLFKGTRQRTAQQISRELDMLGGMSNAFTSTEQTCYFATVLDTHLPRAVDLLTDLFLNSVFSQSETELERQVILQEIAMVEDTPDDRIHELFASLFWGDHPLGNTVLGRPEVVSSLSGERLKDYVSSTYIPGRIVISAVGSIDHQAFVSLCRSRFEKIASVAPESFRQPPACGGQEITTTVVQERPLEQEHLILGCKGLPLTSGKRYSLMLLNTILGGNMSSRLFQEIREKRGLAYSIYSYLVSQSDGGYLGLYLGVDPQSLKEAMSLIYQQLEIMRNGPIESEELVAAAEYFKGGMYLSAENMEARMTRLARNEFSFGRNITIDEVVAQVDRIGVDDVEELAAMILPDSSYCLAAIGPVSEDEIKQEIPL